MTDHDLLADHLIGRGGHAIPNLYFDTPTDPLQVLRRFYAEHGESPASARRLASALIAASRDPQRGWMAVYYAPDILQCSAEIAATGEPSATQVLAEVLANVAAQRQDLQALRQWAGSDDPRGCWGVVDRFVRRFLADTGLPELAQAWPQDAGEDGQAR